MEGGHRNLLRSGMRTLFTLLLSFHLFSDQPQLTVGFNVAKIIRLKPRYSGRNIKNSPDSLFASTDRVRLELKQTNNDGADEARPLQTMEFPGTLSLSIIPIAMVFTLVFLVPMSAFGLENLLANADLGKPVSASGVDPRFFLSGGLCASISHGITTPIDVVKTRIQSDPQKYDGLNILGSSKTVVEDAGYEVLLKGFGPTVIGYGLEGAAKFGIYENLKPTIAGLLDPGSPNIAYVIASVVAGGAASVILCPLERTRIRLVTDREFSEKNLFTGLLCLIEESGVASLFYGLPAMLSKQCPYTLGKQATYDAICAALYAVVSVNGASTKIEISIAAAFCASIVACVLSQPGDVILTETYKEKSDSNLSRIFPQVLDAIYTERDGLKGFYTGFLARLIQVVGIITSQLLLYDFIKQGLGLPATGSS